MPTGLGGWQRQCGEWAWAVTSQTSGMGQLAGEKATLRVPTSCTPFPGSLPSLLVVSRAPGGPNCALSSAQTWTAGAGAGGTPGALIGPLRLRGPGQLQRSLWVLKGLPWSSRVPAVPRVQAWAAGLLGLAGAWGSGTLLNAWSVYVAWNLRSQLTPRMEVWGVRLCFIRASVHPRNISECSCWQAPEVNESNLLISTGKAGPERARDSCTASRRVQCAYGPQTGPHVWIRCTGTSHTHHRCGSGRPWRLVME